MSERKDEFISRVLTGESPSSTGSRGVRRHDLKTWPEFFADLMAGNKPFELRKNDRDFQVGDELCLHEYDPATKAYSGRSVVRVVTYILGHRPDAGCAATFGLQPGHVIMGIRGAAQPPSNTIDSVSSCGQENDYRRAQPTQPVTEWIAPPELRELYANSRPVQGGKEAVAYCGWHPKHGYALQTAGHDQQHAASLLMRTDIAGNHGWSVQPLFAAPQSASNAGGNPAGVRISNWLADYSHDLMEEGDFDQEVARLAEAAQWIADRISDSATPQAAKLVSDLERAVSHRDSEGRWADDGGSMSPAHRGDQAT